MKFGQYELLERVAVGGMAEVYRGRVAGAEGFEKWVAIKRILPEFARDERFISMMLTEARIHSALSHRNIVQIHDLGISEDGEYFIVLEYVEGHDLRAVMEAATELGVQIPDSLALHVADQLAQALHFAHELTDPEGQPLGIIHRDVSPSNVLISNSGEVKLSDFGIAKRRNDHSFVGSLKGNLVYMSPEQARRVPLDRRTDVFSLGAVLFEMVTGHKVREITDEVSGFRDVASGVVRSARALRPDLPESYERLLARALASNPADRFQDAAAFGLAIRELGREHDAPVGPADMKELVELLNPPRRARSPVERSKVIRLGPEFKALAGYGRGGRSNVADPGGEQQPIILAPGVVPVQSVPVSKPNGRDDKNGRGSASEWADGAAGGRLGAATPLPPHTPAAPYAQATPPPLAGSGPTPPPPVMARPPTASKPVSHLAQFDAAEAALHALEFSAGNEMQPTPPPPAVQGPYAPDVVTPVATPRVSGRVTAQRPFEDSAPQVSSSSNSGRVGAPPVEFAATDMAMSMPTPPPRTSTASYPGVSAQGPHRGSEGRFDPADQRTPVLSALPRTTGPFNGYGGTSAALTTSIAPVGRRSAWPSVIVALLVVLSAGATVVHFKVVPLDVLAVWLKPATLTVSSDPAGATVSLDGRALPSPTPTSVEVRRDRADHVLEFTRVGSLPVRAVARFDRSVALSETVSLPAAPLPPAPPPPPEVPAAAPAPAVAAEPAAPGAPSPPADAEAGSDAAGTAAGVATETNPDGKAATKAERRAALKAAKVGGKGANGKAKANAKANKKAARAAALKAEKKKAKKKAQAAQKRAQKKPSAEPASAEL